MTYHTTTQRADPPGRRFEAPALTDHAVERWLFRRGSTASDLAQARERMLDEIMSEGRIVWDPPSWVDPKHKNDGYLVFGPNVYPLVLHDGRWVAKTYLHKAHAERKVLEPSRTERLLASLVQAEQRQLAAH